MTLVSSYFVVSKNHLVFSAVELKKEKDLQTQTHAEYLIQTQRLQCKHHINMYNILLLVLLILKYMYIRYFKTFTRVLLKQDIFTFTPV